MKGTVVMQDINKKSFVFLTALLVASPVQAEQTSSQPLTPKGKAPKQATDSVNLKVSDELRAKLPGELLRESNRSEISPTKQFEGKPVASVTIVGNGDISAEAFAPHFAVKVGESFSEENLKKDSRMVYMTGHYQTVVPHVMEKDGKIHVVYQATENPPFKALEVTGTTKLDVNQMPALLGLRVGERVNMKTVGSNLKVVDEQYKQMGYSLFAVTGMELTPDGVLHLSCREGIVEDIRIKGNKRTKDYVIGRQIRQALGEPFNGAMVEHSVKRLYSLGLFDDVDVQVVPGNDPNKIQLIFTVDEANTAMVGVGTTYSESDKFVGQFSIGDRNFLGTGDDIQLKWEFGGKTLRNYDFSYTRPYLDEKGTTFNINLYDGIHESAEYDHQGHENARFDKRAVGQEITFSRADTPVTRNLIRIKNRKDEYKGAVGGYNTQYFEDSYNEAYYRKYGRMTTAEERRKEDFGTTRSIRFSRIYDNRDNANDPHSGKRNEISFEWAGFGGDFSFRKLSFDQRYYWPMGPKSEKLPRHVLALDLAAGYAWGDMPLSQRFYMGGASTLRGYEDGQFRGNSMLRASLEYRVPLAKKVAILGFIDSGYAWDKREDSAFDLKKIQYGYGLGLRVQTPLGPVKLDYGIGKDEDGDRKGRFHFSFGTSF